jgi:hypothetical protein
METIDHADWSTLDPTQPLVIEDHDPPSQRAQEWLSKAAALGLACGREVFGKDTTLQMDMVFLVRFAASTVWRISGGDPCWSKLNVETLKRELKDFGFEDNNRVAILAGLGSFYAFLLKRRLLSSDSGEPLLQELFPYVTEHYRRGLASSRKRAATKIRSSKERPPRPPQRGGRRRTGRRRRTARTAKTTSAATKRSPFVPADWLP